MPLVPLVPFMPIARVVCGRVAAAHVGGCLRIGRGAGAVSRWLRVLDRLRAQPALQLDVHFRARIVAQGQQLQGLGFEGERCGAIRHGCGAGARAWRRLPDGWTFRPRRLLWRVRQKPAGQCPAARECGFRFRAPDRGFRAGIRACCLGPGRFFRRCRSTRRPICR